jgi:hypothetical protein
MVENFEKHWLKSLFAKTCHWSLSCAINPVHTLKQKLSHYTPWSRLGERWCSSYSFFTSTLHGDEWSASHPGRALPPEKEPPVPIVQEAGWAPEPVCTQWLEEKSFRLCWGSNLDRPVVQSVARHCTAWATPTPVHTHQHYFFKTLLNIILPYVSRKPEWILLSCFPTKIIYQLKVSCVVHVPPI